MSKKGKSKTKKREKWRVEHKGFTRKAWAKKKREKK